MNHLVNVEFDKSTNYSESFDNVVFASQTAMNQLSNLFNEQNQCLITDNDCNDVIKLYEKLSTHPKPSLVVRAIYRSICERIYSPVNYDLRMIEYVDGDTEMYSQYATKVTPNEIADVCIVDKDINLIVCLFLLVTNTKIDSSKKHHEIDDEIFKSIEIKLNSIIDDLKTKLKLSYSVVH